jgi:hypothetical protein
MRFSLDVMRARKGDCLMLHYGTQDSPHLVMIDGGPSDVYKPHLRPRITRIREARQLDDDESLPVDVLMISHVDDDHIKGILDLTKELKGQTTDREPLLIRVASLWHNSFDDLFDTTPKELELEAGFGEAAVAGAIEVGNHELDAAKVLASIPQGRDLRNDARFLKWKPNDKFKGKLILATKGSTPITLDGGLTFTVIGPMQPELRALQKDHDKWLKQLKDKRTKSPEAALAAFVDASIPNLSSIVLLAEAGGRRMLLTGDARGDKVLKGLELTGLLKPGKTLHVDVLKVPHHGSANNMETAFFKRVTADHYVFSGDGKHGNPERETLEMLFEARGHASFVMHFTYPLADVDVERKKDWEKEQAREKKKRKAKPRPNWSQKKHSLTAFFVDIGLAGGQTVKIVQDKKPHVIDLLDKVDF